MPGGRPPGGQRTRRIPGRQGGAEACKQLGGVHGGEAQGGPARLGVMVAQPGCDPCLYQPPSPPPPPPPPVPAHLLRDRLLPGVPQRPRLAQAQVVHGRVERHAALLGAGLVRGEAGAAQRLGGLRQDVGGLGERGEERRAGCAGGALQRAGRNAACSLASRGRMKLTTPPIVRSCLHQQYHSCCSPWKPVATSAARCCPPARPPQPSAPAARPPGPAWSGGCQTPSSGSPACVWWCVGQQLTHEPRQHGRHAELVSKSARRFTLPGLAFGNRQLCNTQMLCPPVSSSTPHPPAFRLACTAPNPQSAAEWPRPPAPARHATPPATRLPHPTAAAARAPPSHGGGRGRTPLLPLLPRAVPPACAAPQSRTRHNTTTDAYSGEGHEAAAKRTRQPARQAAPARGQTLCRPARARSARTPSGDAAMRRLVACRPALCAFLSLSHLNSFSTRRSSSWAVLRASRDSSPTDRDTASEWCGEGEESRWQGARGQGRGAELTVQRQSREERGWLAGNSVQTPP